MGKNVQDLQDDWLAKQDKANAIASKYSSHDHDLTNEEMNSIVSAQLAWEKLVKAMRG